MDERPPWERATRAEVLIRRRYKNCAVSVGIWNEKTSVLVDSLVLGHSLAKHKMQSSKIACCSIDLLSFNVYKLLRAFWDVAAFRSDLVPNSFRTTENTKVKGLFAKIDAWRLFSQEEEWRRERVMMMNGSMLLRENTDYLFHMELPAAVMKSSQHQWYFERPPLEASLLTRELHSSPSFRYKDGINTGLFLFSPSTLYHHYQIAAFQSLYPPLPDHLEVDFTADFWGTRGRDKVWAIHEKYNYKIPHSPWIWAPPEPTFSPPPYDDAREVCDPEDVRVWNFSAKVKPSDVLLNMEPTRGWQYVDEILRKLDAYLKEADAEERQGGVWLST